MGCATYWAIFSQKHPVTLYTNQKKTGKPGSSQSKRNQISSVFAGDDQGDQMSL
jgi:hypothetical protein